MRTSKKIFLHNTLLILFTLLSFNIANAQRTVVTGVVKDAITKETLPYVSIYFNNTNIGTQSDIDGNFRLSTTESYDKLRFNFVGYEVVIKNIRPGETQKIDVLLKPNAQLLNEITIVAGKKRYANKNNPAVELIRKVIDNKDKNQPKAYETVQYKEYEKMLFSMSNISEKFMNRKFLKNYQFLFQEQDSTKIGGKNILPIYIQEKIANQYLSFSPNKSKKVVLAEQQVEFDNRFIDNKGMKAYFDRMYQDINIYDNNISLISNEFLSPIANAAPTFYKYFITDTIKTKKPYLVELSFTPRSKGDMLFEGKIYVTLDGNYAVQKAILGVNKNINLNFVRALDVNLSFAKNTDNRYYLSKSNLIADFGISKNKGMGFTGERSVSYDNYTTNAAIPDTIFSGKKIEVLADAALKSNNFWTENRLDTISAGQLKIYKNVDTLQTIPAFKRTVKLVSLLFAGYLDVGPYEIGPTNTFYSFNNVEGLRLRFGGRTTTSLSQRFYVENYAAYGFKDEKWKYFVSGTYSLNNKSIYKFPQHYIRASFQRDTKIPGQELQFVQEDNFLLSFKRGINDMLLYNDFYRLDYVREFENKFSYNIGFKRWTQSPAGGLLFKNATNNTPDQYLTTSEFAVGLRYAKNEKFIQGKLYRTPIVDRHPIYNFKYTTGVKGLFGGEFNYHNFMGSVDKRTYLSQLGYSDIRLEGGYVLGKVPFPLLGIHRANQTYAYQLNSYNLMNFLEFVSDHYVGLNIDHNFNGFFLNKIPLLNKLKLREIISFKGIYGGVRDENNPTINPNNLYSLPTFDDGTPRTFSLNKKPYMEASVGLGNIFKFVRVDLVRRLTYLENPEVVKWGIRTRVKFDF